MVDHNKFILRVTAGSSYDVSTHQEVKVNTSDAVNISSDDIDATIRVRVKNYRGLPKDSPSDAEYFSHPSHTRDLYSIDFSFKPKQTWSGDEIVFGNDFDHPIRDRLPPGFGYALKLVKWMIDPGLDGDPYADIPWLYGPLLSSVNILRIGDKDAPANDEEKIVEEGAEGEGEEIRQDKSIPENPSARMKHFLTESNRTDFEFEAGREYKCDFFNPYLDFNEFALKLPGFTLSIISSWDGQPLRYVLKRRYKDKDIKDSTLLFVVCFTLLPVDQ
ncbi:DUF1769-domain-containing protein, partial [Rhizodiscina lignyota]